MNEQKLKRKLAKQSGFKKRWMGCYCSMCEGVYIYPSGEGSKTNDFKDLPDFLNDLNACFKWLVPEALKLLTEKGYIPPVIKLFQLWYDELVSLTGDSSGIQQPALALCLAISKLIERDIDK